MIDCDHESLADDLPDLMADRLPVAQLYGSWVVIEDLRREVRARGGCPLALVIGQLHVVHDDDTRQLAHTRTVIAVPARVEMKAVGKAQRNQYADAY
ncbi:hypothetical protein D3C72_2118200 [compost metagenome]